MSQYRTLIPIFDELRGPRIIVRPYHVEDAEALYEAVSQSRDHLRPWMDFADEHQSVEESRDFIIHSMANWLLRENFLLGIWEQTTGAFLGGTAFTWAIGNCAGSRLATGCAPQQRATAI